ncbi:MAG: VanW family protein [Coriobacteriales bacterium]|nr:VanW family protein [Coriobacteriales bacterium]
MPQIESPQNKRSSSDGRKALRKINEAADRRSGKKRSKRVVAGSTLGSFLAFFNTPLKLRVGLIALALLLLLGGLGIYDTIANFGKVHSGVSVAGVDVGGLSPDQAAERLEEELSQRAAAAPVGLFGDEQSAQWGITDETPSISGGVSDSDPDAQLAAANHSWRVTFNSVGAYVDGATLAQRAYEVGRGADFFGGRFMATLLGVQLEGELTYDDSQLKALESLLTESLGRPVKNADIEFDGETFVVLSSLEGYAVDHSSFTARLTAAFLGEQRSVIIPMRDEYVQITDEMAQEVAAQVQEAIAQSIALVYENESWSLSTATLGSWISTSIEGITADEGEGEAAATVRLVARIDPEKIRGGINAVIGDINPGVQPIKAKFEVVDDAVTIIPSVDGTGIDFNTVAADLNRILFERADAVRKITLTVTTLQPDLTTEQAEALHINQKIATFTTDYASASTAKITNVHLISDLLNNSLVEPGGIWSFNGISGERTTEKGFQEAKSVIEGAFVDEIGGGICQVATTIYNAIFDSGFPIEERFNHALYVPAYPDARDAAVSWPDLDLKFKNDSSDWVLVTVTYTDTTVTATLWGTDPGYTVEYELSDWIAGDEFKTKEIKNPDMLEGERKVRTPGRDGASITIRRFVYGKNGELIRDATFKSTYESETEVVEVGTKKPEVPLAPPPGTTPTATPEATQ